MLTIIASIILTLTLVGLVASVIVVDLRLIDVRDFLSAVVGRDDFEWSARPSTPAPTYTGRASVPFGDHRRAAPPVYLDAIPLGNGSFVVYA
jgi:hypothetical protein